MGESVRMHSQKVVAAVRVARQPRKVELPRAPRLPGVVFKAVLKLSEFKECKKIFKEKGMKTFADWLRYYNNLDIAPGLEALEKM